MAPVAGFNERKREYFLKCKSKKGYKKVKEGRCGDGVCLRRVIQVEDLRGLKGEVGIEKGAGG